MFHIDIDELDWDEENEQHVGDHGVTMDEVREVVESQSYGRRHRGRLIVLGQTIAGRYLFVVLDEMEKGRWRPITAREMDEKERAFLRRQKRGKGEA